MKKIIIYSALFSLLLGMTACLKDLDQTPYVEVTSEVVYKDPASYHKILARLYSGLSTTGQQGPAGKPDIVVPDEGFSEYTRQYWKLQELCTDEAIVGWGDFGLQDLHAMNWSSSNQFITNFYNRIFYQISSCNEFIRETSDERLRARGVADAVAPFIKSYRAEARFLRALSYFHAIDMYGNVPFTTEADAVSAFFPRQISRAELCTYVESELKAIEADLLAPKGTIIGRANQAACWSLLARFYLNHEVYTGVKKYNEALTYSKKVIDAGYPLHTNYKELFMADNSTNNKEIIFAVQSDGKNTQSWGATTFLVNGAIGGSMIPSDYGTAEKWGGLRTTKSLVNRFTAADLAGTGDNRALFYSNGQKLEIEKVTTFTEGYALPKYVNKTSTGVAGSHPKHSDVDFPMFRAGEANLIYAEAVLRGATNGDKTTALSLVNNLRTRAKATSISNTDLTIDFILDERSRELYWEGVRRSDLIRYGRFTGSNFLWPWKGNVKEGVEVPAYLALYPIPSDDLVANPNLKQNPGY
jgi:starch-binding outer membrane protein, SusD/RagB family